MVAEVVEDAVDASADASSRQGGEVLDHAQGKAVFFRCVGPARDTGWSERAARLAASRRASVPSASAIGR